MNGPSGIPREIVEWPSFTHEANQLDPGRRSLDQELEGLLFVIARIPEEFQQVEGTRLHVAHYTGNQPLRIWFTYNDTRIILLGIEPDE